MKTRKEIFLDQFKENFSSVTVDVHLPDCLLPEQITNPKENFKAKASYYERAYDDDLRLKTNPVIFITGYTFHAAGISVGTLILTDDDDYNDYNDYEGLGEDE